MPASMYAELLRESDVDSSPCVTGQNSRFFNAAANAIGAIANYVSPVCIQLKIFEYTSPIRQVRIDEMHEITRGSHSCN